MKKTVALVLAVLMMLLFAGAASADGVLSEEMSQAILGAKERIGLDDEAYVLENCYENQRRGQTEYQIYWKSRNAYESGGISVTADANGNLWSYDGPGTGKTQIFPACTEEEAIGVAEAFLSKVNPEIAANSTYSQVTYSKYGGAYTVQYTRVHNGIWADNTANVSVDSQTKEVVSLYSNWSRNASFEEGDMITEEAAKEIFKAEVGYALAYNAQSAYYPMEESEDKIHLIYALRDSNKFISALTGEAMTSLQLAENVRAEAEDGAMSYKNADASGASSLSEEEIAYLEEMEGLISAEKAEEILRGIKELELTEDMLATGISLRKSQNNAYAYSFFFNNGKENEDYRYASAEIDAKDGALYDFYSTPENSEQLTEEEKKAAEEDHKALAQAFIQAYYPDRAEQVEPKKTDYYGGFFARMHNGIPFQNNGFHFSYQNGKLNRFSMTWSHAQIPEKGEIKSINELYDAALGEGRFGLRYMPTYSGNDCTMRAVYFLLETNNYHPETLAPLNYRMEEETDMAYAYTDLAGHYGESAVKAMYEAEIYLGDPGETLFNPADGITQEAFLTLACKAFERSTYNLYPRLVDDGVLTQEEIAPEKEITRMEAIRYIVGILELSELAEQPRIFESIYTDVEEQDRGYAAIAAGYGIVNSEVSALYPTNPLRRADAVIMMYNWLIK